MNTKLKEFLQNFSYTITSNLLALVISTVVILIVPKLLGVSEYGYWQLYLFYVSYVGFLHFGWNDGVYLRYGGEHYEDLNKNKFFSQFYMLVILEFVISFLLIIYSIFFVKNVNKIFIFEMLSICLFLSNIRHMLLFILQATNRIKAYSRITIADRLVYFILILLLLLFGFRNYKLMVIADLIGRATSLIYAMFLCKEIVINNFKNFSLDFLEAYYNVSSGIKLMFSNIASMLIIGIVRFGIEKNWDVATFGKVSLTLSISNMMMIFINAIGVIMFPVLRRMESQRLFSLYKIVRDILMVTMLSLLIAYYPIRIFLESWLPKYKDSLVYMGILFPIFIFEGKMSLLINTYLKTLREEKIMLKLNIVTVLFSCILTLICTVYFKELDLAIFSIILLLAFRSIIFEYKLSRIININLNNDIFLEVLITTIFVLSNWYLNLKIAFLCYVVSYFLYVLIKRKEILSLKKNIYQVFN